MPLLQPQMPMQGNMPEGMPQENMSEAMPEDMTEEEALPEQAKANPKDQEIYDRVVVAGMSLLNNKSIHSKIFKTLEAGKASPAKALGRATLQIMSILKEKTPDDIPDTVVGSAAIEIMIMLAEEADSAGIFTVDERTLKGSGEILIRGLADMYGVSREEMDQAASPRPPANEAMPQQQSVAPATPTMGV